MDANKNMNIFRLIHFDNLEDTLRNGMYSRNSGHIVPNFVNIGDTTLIKQRETFTVPINPPNGNLGDYIPFYFAGHSPMLLNIKTGARGIQKRDQKDLIYIVCKVHGIVDNCHEWCFTDGHTKNHLTKFFNNLDKLDDLDWETIRSQYWHNTEEDYDRIRRKQAEFLVKSHVPATCICGLIVLDADQENRAKEIMQNAGLELPIYIDIKRKYFYP